MSNQNPSCFETKLHGKVFLYKKTRKLKSCYPEREYLILNQKAIEDVLKNPIQVRRSLSFTDDYLYYKLLKDIPIDVSDEGIKRIYSHLKYVAVVICTKSQRIKTIYPAMKIKKGEKIWPK